MGAAAEGSGLSQAPGATVPPAPPGAPDKEPPDVRRPELAEAYSAFERGDFRTLRRVTSAVLSRRPPPDEALRREASALRARVSVDPLAVALGVGCVLFFLAILYFVYR